MNFKLVMTSLQNLYSLVPRPSPAPVFDRLHTASDQKLQAIKNWSRGRPAWERGYMRKQATARGVCIGVRSRKILDFRCSETIFGPK